MKTPFLIAGLLTAICVGCGEAPEASFVLQKETRDLMKEARGGYTNDAGEKIPGVEDYLTELFGTPENLVAWQKLPIDFGGSKGAVAQTVIEETAADGTKAPIIVTPGEKVRRIKVKWDDESPTVPEEGRFELVWTSGDDAYTTTWSCAGYDKVKGELIVDNSSVPGMEELPVLPPEGKTFIVDAGRTLKNGRGLYMTHCMHCHGVSGDGNGATAKYLKPLPRDYRKGIFKFTSTNKDTFKDRHSDLDRVIKYGIPGTYMPSFLLLEDDELHAIVEYVRWLSMRGEVERAMTISLLSEYSNSKEAMDQLEGQAMTPEGGVDQGKLNELLDDRQQRLLSYLAGGDEGNFSEDLTEEADFLVDAWASAESDDSLLIPSVPRTEMTKTSIEAGRLLFLGKANCANCHGIAGKGDGPQTMEISEESKKLGRGPGLYDTWGHPLKPRNLTTGIYRGGRRPIDIYRRIRAGVKGAVMPAAAADITDAQVWDIVNFVLSIPLDPEDVAEAASAKPDADKKDEAEQADSNVELPSVDTVAN